MRRGSIGIMCAMALALIAALTLPVSSSAFLQTSTATHHAKTVKVTKQVKKHKAKNKHKAKKKITSAKKASPSSPKATAAKPIAPVSQIRPTPPATNTQNETVNAVLTNRAMWLWNWSSNDAVLDFARNHNVTEIFTYAHPGFSQTPDLLTKLTQLSDRGRKAGITMWAMGGDPAWVTDHATAIAWINEVRASRLFTGIHFEIEPHNQVGYWQNQDARNEQFIGLLTEAAQAAGSETLELSLPWWYHTINYGTTTLDAAAMKLVDQVTIVTFADTVNEIRNDAQQAVAVARELKKPYRFASETNEIDPEFVSFYGDSNSNMIQAQNTVSQDYLKDSLYLGFAVEEYEGWAKMRA